jgi:hypothetical protein
MTRNSAYHKALAITLTLVAIVATHTAHAQESNSGWSFVLAPYAWGPAMDGSTAIQGHEAPLDISREDFVDHFDGGFMGTAAARKGAWGVYADVVWTDLGGSSAMPPVEVDPTLAIMSMNVLRRITPYADATAGVRWNHLSTRVELGPPLSMNLDKSRDWVDPVVGVVLRSPELGRFHGAVVADIGGFGVSSDFTWQVFPTIGYTITPWLSAETGWRFLDVDYTTDEDGGFTYDVLVDGPAVGVAFRF